MSDASRFPYASTSRSTEDPTNNYTFKCNNCKYVTNNRTAWNNHKIKHIIRCKKGASDPNAKYSERIFYKQANYKEHLKLVHGRTVWFKPVYGHGPRNRQFETHNWVGDLVNTEKTSLGLNKYEYVLNFRNVNAEKTKTLDGKILFIRECITDIISQFKKLLQHFSDRIQLVIRSHPDDINYTLATKFCTKKTFNARNILNHVVPVLQSNKKFELSDNLHINVTLYSKKRIAGGSPSSLSIYANYYQALKKKKSIVFSEKSWNSNYCLSEAIIIGQTYIRFQKKYISKRIWDKFRKGLRYEDSSTRCRAKLLHHCTNINPFKKVPLHKVHRFEKHCHKYGITITCNYLDLYVLHIVYYASWWPSAALFS